MKEIRIAEIRAENQENEKDEKTMILRGTPIVFDTPTVIHDLAGSYTEVIKAGALDSADLSDVRLLYNHNPDKVPLARTPKTMQLRISPAGMEMQAVLPNTEEARAVYESVKRGDLSGMSFAFKVSAGGDLWDPATNTRFIHKIDKILECSVVPFPAYPTASVEARSARQGVLERYQAKQKIKIMCNQIRKVNG